MFDGGVCRGIGKGGRGHESDLDPVGLTDVADGQGRAVLEQVAVDHHGEDAGQSRRLTHIRVIRQSADQDPQGVGHTVPELGSGLADVRGNLDVHGLVILVGRMRADP
ncbi:hypothetical protein AB0D91_44870 [Streptomyces canus]|uniref:hypothetical protein n=1 Tax=Streptomyces canus TaxID=58343 RepID=UPI00340C00BA